MKKPLLTLLIALTGISSFAQITVTQADFGQAGDSIVVGYDSPGTTMSVGGTGSQNWNFNFAVTDINTLKFQYVNQATSGPYFPQADLAIERMSDTLFFESSATEFSLDGIAGDGFGFGFAVRVDFDPNAKQMVFPSTFGTSFLDTAVFDTIVDCDAFGQGGLCDSARIRRTMISNSTINAHGQLVTSGGTYNNTIRQYLREDSQDRVWVKLPFLGWQNNPIYSADSTVFNYRWYANGEDWPVLSVLASAAGGNIIQAEFKVDENLLGYVISASDASCFGECDGQATVKGLGGLPPYSYEWPASAGSVSTATANGLCAGSYAVTVTDQNDSTYVIAVEIGENSALQITASIQPAVFGGDGAIDITVSGGTGAGTYTYDWTGPNGFSATTADISNLDSGLYTVMVNDENGCDTNRSFYMTMTGVRETPSASFEMFPNPANADVALTSTVIMQHYKVMDLLGNVVFSAPLKGTQAKLSTSELSSGIYMVEVSTVQGKALKKLTVQH